jgi:serine/threonine protein kinase
MRSATSGSGFSVSMTISTQARSTGIEYEALVGTADGVVVMYLYRSGSWSEAESIACPIYGCPTNYPNCVEEVSLISGLLICSSAYTSKLKCPIVFIKFKFSICISAVDQLTIQGYSIQNIPSLEPSVSPMTSPTMIPTDSPSLEVSLEPSVSPMTSPTIIPTDSLSFKPSNLGIVIPSKLPSMSPSIFPTVNVTHVKVTTLDGNQYSLSLNLIITVSGIGFCLLLAAVILFCISEKRSQSKSLSGSEGTDFDYHDSIKLSIVSFDEAKLPDSEDMDVSPYPDFVRHSRRANGTRMNINGAGSQPNLVTSLVTSQSSNDIQSQFDNNSESIDLLDYTLFPFSRLLHKFNDVDMRRYLIAWNDIVIADKDSNSAILGQGSFGVVIKASLRYQQNEPNDVQENASSKIKYTNQEVAIKLLTKSKLGLDKSNEFKNHCLLALKEVEVITTAEKAIGCSDHIIKAYGIAEGPLPRAITNLFHTPPHDSGVGIIMRYEGGGSLMKVIHSLDANGNKAKISMSEKLRLLSGVARGLSELHSVGIVHGDIKPENILLSEDIPQKVRLADFGLSSHREEFCKSGDKNTDIELSSLAMTLNTRGTPIYCAPEMLVNPYKTWVDNIVSKSSRKTDMYAFALLMWEVLTQERPFREIMSEPMLCSSIHQGHRPDINVLPSDTFQGLKQLIVDCWDADRSRRKTSLEALYIIDSCYASSTNRPNQILLSHSGYHIRLMGYIFQYLIQCGLTVNTGIHPLEMNISKSNNVPVNQNHHSFKTNIDSTNFISFSSSNIDYIKDVVMVICIDRMYRESEECLNELRKYYKEGYIYVISLEKDSNTAIDISGSNITTSSQFNSQVSNQSTDSYLSNSSSQNCVLNLSDLLEQPEWMNDSVNTEPSTTQILDLHSRLSKLLSFLSIHFSEDILASTLGSSRMGQTLN